MISNRKNIVYEIAPKSNVNLLEKRVDIAAGDSNRFDFKSAAGEIASNLASKRVGEKLNRWGFQTGGVTPISESLRFAPC